MVRDKKGRFIRGHKENDGRARPDVVLRNKSDDAPRNTGKTRFKKGNKNNLGRKMSQYTKDKISKKLLGRSSKTKGMKRPNQCGSNNPSWKGGVTKRTNQIRNSIEYIEWRTKVFQRDKFTCQDCRTIGVNLNAHHKTSFAKLINTKKEYLIFDIDNGITLCVDCHRKKHPELNFKINKR